VLPVRVFNAFNRPNCVAPFGTPSNLARFGRLETTGDRRIV
jgi:hypothetical protein